MLNRRTVLATVRATLAADFACDEAAFGRDGVFIVEARELPGRRRLPLRAKTFMLATVGRGGVVTCSADRLPWARAHLGQRRHDELFSISTLASIATFVSGDRQFLAGPDLKYLCASDTFHPVPPPDTISIDLIDRAHMQELYGCPGFSNALSYRLDTPRPDMLAAVAQQAGTVVGIAAASADSDHLWQIGVDVRADYQGRGIGKALVSRATEAVLAEGRVPYYSTQVGNIRSSNAALGVGYWLAWVEVYARES